MLQPRCPAGAGMPVANVDPRHRAVVRVVRVVAEPLRTALVSPAHAWRGHEIPRMLAHSHGRHPSRRQSSHAR